jgi:hypothetical protein
VTDALPSPLARALEKRGGVPRSARACIDEQLAQGVPAQRLRDRIERRWFMHYSNLTAREIGPRADDLALELVAPTGCRPDCEDGSLLDDSRSCPDCTTPRTQIAFTGDDRGPRATEDGYRQAAAGIRQEMRTGRRSLNAAEERARAERGDVPDQRDARGRRIPETALCAGCRQDVVPVKRWQEQMYCRSCVDACRACSAIHPVTELDDRLLCDDCRS